MLKTALSMQISELVLSKKRTTYYRVGSVMVAGLFNIVSHYRAALVFERWICVAVPIIPHYVNIALGIIFWPCLFVCRDGAAL